MNLPQHSQRITLISGFGIEFPSFYIKYHAIYENTGTIELHIFYINITNGQNMSMYNSKM